MPDLRPRPLSGGSGSGSRARIRRREHHHKSRTGCATCKSRRIKCDEKHPACRNCISYGVECPFLQPPAPKCGCGHSSDSKSEVLPVLELELLHNFVVSTSYTLGDAEVLRKFWRVDCVQIGLRGCDYILLAVLAISALHVAHDRPQEQEFYVTKAIEFYNRACRAAMVNLSQAVEQRDANIFPFSLLTGCFALACPRTSDEYFLSTPSSFLDWTFLISGAKSVVERIDPGEDHPVVQPFVPYIRRRRSASRDNRDDAVLERLRQRIHGSVHDKQLLQVYDSSIDELELTFRAQKQSGDAMDAMLWLWEVSDSLVPLLKVSDQVAVAIYAHFSRLLEPDNDHWAIGGWAARIQAHAREILDDEHKNWIEWASTKDKVEELAPPSPD